MRKNDIKYYWDEETKSAVCIIIKGNHCYTGSAICHPEDADFVSQRTGQTIAEMRANINLLRAYRDNWKERVSALKQFYYSINKSKRHNAGSYESKMLKRQIKIVEEELAVIMFHLKDEEAALRQYLNDKEELYKKLRENRKNEVSVENVEKSLEENAEVYAQMKKDKTL